jgi:hypothetical protein
MPQMCSQLRVSSGATLSAPTCLPPYRIEEPLKARQKMTRKHTTFILVSPTWRQLQEQQLNKHEKRRNRGVCNGRVPKELPIERPCSACPNFNSNRQLCPLCEGQQRNSSLSATQLNMKMFDDPSRLYAEERAATHVGKRSSNTVDNQLWRRGDGTGRDLLPFVAGFDAPA